MTVYRPCKCVYCGETLDRNTEEWEQAPSNRYAHKTCYDKKQKELQEQKTEREYRAKIHEKIKEVCGIQYVKTKTEKQIKKYLEEGMTAVGIFKALEYWYDIKKSDPAEAKGGIGIVPYIYHDSNLYWEKQNAIKAQNTNTNDDLIEDYLTIQDSLPRQCNHKERIVKPKRKTFFMLD